jgi:prepilin-type N-terminal cleavage/methylation domain-containing protein
MKSRRAGFTMIELLIAITIILILAAVAATALNGNRQTGKLRDAARIGQSAFLGAKDRALHAKDLRGVRLIRDTTDGTLITAFTYLQPLPLQSTGNLVSGNQLDFALARPNYATTGSLDATRVMISGTQAASWFQQDSSGIWPANRVQIRIPSSLSPTGGGPWYNLAPQSTTPPYWGTMNAGVLWLNLQTPFSGGKPPQNVNNSNAIDTPDANASCDIQLGNDLLPFHQPISLPSAVVIDLKFSSQNVQSLGGINTAFIPYIDLMFSPRGMLTGSIAAQGPLHFFLRTLDDATATANFVDAQGNTGTAGYYVGTAALPDPNKSERLILTVFPQTGLVSTFEFDPTDANGDGLADNPFNLAQLGKSAGR